MQTTCATSGFSNSQEWMILTFCSAKLCAQKNYWFDPFALSWKYRETRVYSADCLIYPYRKIALLWVLLWNWTKYEFSDVFIYGCHALILEQSKNRKKNFFLWNWKAEILIFFRLIKLSTFGRFKFLAISVYDCFEITKFSVMHTKKIMREYLAFIFR